MAKSGGAERVEDVLGRVCEAVAEGGSADGVEETERVREAVAEGGSADGVEETVRVREGVAEGGSADGVEEVRAGEGVEDGTFGPEKAAISAALSARL